MHIIYFSSYFEDNQFLTLKFTSASPQSLCLALLHSGLEYSLIIVNSLVDTNICFYSILYSFTDQQLTFFSPLRAYTSTF